MLTSPLLENVGARIDGKWISRGLGGAVMPVIDPASGEPLAEIPVLSKSQTVSAIESAAAAFRESTPSPDERRRWLLAISSLLLEHKEELARIITLEQGKPLAESRVEVEYASRFFGFFAEQLSILDAGNLPEPIKKLHWSVHHRPAGVVGLITPWNFPLAMIAKKLAPALAAGCAAVVKPSELTPLTTIALWHLMDRAGVPLRLFNLVVGDPAGIGAAMCEHPAVRLISFTGSTRVGKLLSAQAAPYVKRLSLELGGNAPYIVCDDADLPAAADALMANKFRCAGQTCVCANRILVQRGAVPAFTDLIVERVKQLHVGPGIQPETNIGPLINRAAFDKVKRHVSEALAAGAKRLAGADPATPPGEFGCFFPPTVLAPTNADMSISKEETFGPVVAIASFDTEEQAVDLANGTPFGLAAYLFTGDQRRAERMTARLSFGHVGVNTGMGPTPEAPFGGMKQSGFGREGGVEGLLEFCETQTVVRP